jgi:hypothetical protein
VSITPEHPTETQASKYGRRRAVIIPRPRLVGSEWLRHARQEEWYRRGYNAPLSLEKETKAFFILITHYEI